MKYLLIAIICTLVLSSCIFGAGSYANSESYIVDIPYKDSEAIMRKLKETYPEYQYYVTSDSGKVEKYEDSDGFIAYYLPNINYAVGCRILPLDDPEQTRVLLVSTANTEKNTGSKRINTGELTREENKMIKKEFEKQILPKLGKWDHHANALFRFLGLN